VLALSLHLAKPAHQPDRTLVFVISGGHHSTGLNGPQNLVRMNKPLLSKTVMVVNLEHVAQLAIHQSQGHDIVPWPWQADPVEQQMGFAISNQAPFLIELGHRARERYGFNVGANFGSNVPGDLGGYEPLGVARVQAIHSGPMYHTSGDTLDTISLPGLERAARFFAYFVTEAAKAPRSAIDPKP
jgi:Peptidase family M28